MAKYKVIAEFELEGAAQAVDTEIELAEDVAAPLIEAGNIELVAEGAAEGGDEGDEE